MPRMSLTALSVGLAMSSNLNLGLFHNMSMPRYSYMTPKPPYGVKKQQRAAKKLRNKRRNK